MYELTSRVRLAIEKLRNQLIDWKIGWLGDCIA